MQPARFDLLGIGNAIVDVVAPVEPAFLSRHDLRPGTMALVDAERAAALTQALPPGREGSGGSAANTCAVASVLGARVAFLGKVADDALGEAFRRDIAAAGVHFPTAPLHGGAGTARCLIAVTPDGQRTMSTFLGACVDFGEADLDPALLADSAVTYLEGYLFDPPAAQAAFRRAVTLARAAGRQVALSLSDAFCVDRHRDAFHALLRSGVDVLFANEAEACSLFQVGSLEEALPLAAAAVPLAALTRGAEGSVVLRGDERVAVPAEPARVVDTTGAGDAFAAGFLAAHVAGHPIEECARRGGRTAAAVIAHLGARPEVALAGLAG